MDDVGCCVMYYVLCMWFTYKWNVFDWLTTDSLMQTIYYVLITSMIYIMCSFIDCCEANNNHSLVSIWAIAFGPSNNSHYVKQIKPLKTLSENFGKKEKVSMRFMKWPMTKSTPPSQVRCSEFEVRIWKSFLVENLRWTNQTKCARKLNWWPEYNSRLKQINLYDPY